MDPILGGAIIGGAANLIGGGLTAASQGSINRKTRRWQEKMWHKNNVYNSPVEQRKRLEAAGLNPNLVYGGSASGVTGNSSMPSQPDLKAVDYTQAASAIGQTAQNYFSYKQAQTGIELNEERKENIKQDTINKSIDAVGKAIKNSQGQLDYATKARLFNTTVKTAEERLRNLSINTDYIRNKDARETMITNTTVSKIMSEIRNIKTQGRILNEEAIMKRVDRELYEKYRIRPQDPLYYRIIGEIMEKLNVNPFKN